jgi:nickel transport protein
MSGHVRCLVLITAIFLASPAHAHQLKVFATVTGRDITAEAYFVGGRPAANAIVAVVTLSGEALARGETDATGTFRMTASTPVDHVITVESGDGHVARAVIPASDLPQGLAAHATNALPSGRDCGTAAAAQDLVAAAVAQQLRPLREQLNAYEDQVRLRDILGGIGTILGLAGIALWARSRR